MQLEKVAGNIKWFRKNKIRIKLKTIGKESKVWVSVDGYNICFVLILYEIEERIREDILLNISVKKTLDKQRIFIVDAEHALEFVNYLYEFINKWDIKIPSAAVSDSDFISDELWYK